MEKNEYRRSLIMLRTLERGYSGHARIEIRTLTGFLNIVASVPASARSVNAVLTGSCRGTYFVVPLGTLRRDLRGQATLSVTFDPRNIGGRTIDAYPQLILVNTDARCTLVLAGNLCGSCFPNWSEVTDAVCALYAPARPDTPILPTPSLPSPPVFTPSFPPAENTPAQPDTPILPTPSLPPSLDSPAQPDTPILSTPGLPSESEIPAQPDNQFLPTPSVPSFREMPSEDDALPAEYYPVDDTIVSFGRDTAPGTDTHTASDCSDASDTNKAADDSEASDDNGSSSKDSSSIREGMTETRAGDAQGHVFLTENNNDRAFTRSGWKFTRVNLPEGCLFTHSYVGIPDNSDAPAEICCAIPGTYSPKPPPGLDDYEWSGGCCDGWWIKCYIAR